MSLPTSAILTNRRNLKRSLAAVCLLSLIVIGVFAGTRSSAITIPATNASTDNSSDVPTFAVPVPTPVPIAIPIATPLAIIRDLAQYENGGIVPLGTTQVAGDAAVAQIRAFLLRKWNTQTLGRVALTALTPTGRPMSRNFFIERSSTGAWRITLEQDGSEPEEFFFVEEIGVAANGRPILEPTPGGPQPVSRALHLKHKAAEKNGMVL